MTDGYLLNLRTFREVRDDKAQALKPLEEAAEIYGAWQELTIHDGMTPDADARRAMLRDYVIDECVETIQAAVNMLAALTEHYRVSGVWNFCPGCGRRVVKR